MYVDDKPPVLNNQVNIKSFYDQLRAGANAKTAAVTQGYFEEHMRKSLSEGKDILYLGFSPGLSATYSNGVMVMEEVQKEIEFLKDRIHLFISQSDCLEDAQPLEAMIKEEFGSAEVIIGDIGPVIGARTGPGAIALCYLGKTVKGC